MEPDNEAALHKRSELQSLVKSLFDNSLPLHADKLASDLFANFIVVTPPFRESPGMELITIRHGGRDRGSSVKPGNVTLNLRKLIVGIASGSLTISGALVTPWMLIPGALVVWDSLYSSLEVEIGENEASVIWAMWLNVDAAVSIAKVDVTEITNEERNRYGLPPLSASEIEYALANLAALGCIVDSENEGDRHILVEKVRVDYS